MVFVESEFLSGCRLPALIGTSVARTRAALGLTQEQLAYRLRRHGFTSWTRDVVGALESGRREVSLGDAVVLAAELGLGLPELVPTGELVELSPALTMKAEDVRQLLGGRRAGDFVPVPASEPGAALDMLRVPVAALAAPQRALPRWALDELLRIARQRGMDIEVLHREFDAACALDLERRTARRFGATPWEICLAALRLWGRSLTEERDRRAGASDPAPEHGLRGPRLRALHDCLRKLAEYRGEWRELLERPTSKFKSAGRQSRGAPREGRGRHQQRKKGAT
jgi:transcriptional regulator with XRE-family HTH domain